MRTRYSTLIPYATVASSADEVADFDTHGITPLGYAAFAFTLGVTAGALIRRTVPAMAVTLAIFAALQVAMPLWVRPNLAPAAEPPPRLNKPAQGFTLAGITRITCPVDTVPAWQDLYAAGGTASELVILTRIASMSKSEHHDDRHELTLIAAAGSQMSASSPRGTFSQAELAGDDAMVLIITLAGRRKISRGLPLRH